MSPTSEKSRPTLHIWPRTDSALSLDPSCVAALLYLQLHLPDQYQVEYCANPDLSPTGQLPYLTHGLHSATGYHAIVKHISSRTHLDPTSSLDPAQKAQISARVAHIESSLGDLTSYVYYSLTANWVHKTRHVLVSILPAPQRYYMPDRIRLAYKPRLEMAELWNVAGMEQEERTERERFSFRKPARKNKKAQEKAHFKETFERNKVLDKARATLDIYSRLLGESRFFYDVETPTILDISLAAHIYLLKQDQPDPLIKDLLTKQYPTLVAHADAVQTTAFPDPSIIPTVAAPKTSFTIRSLFPPSGPKHIEPHSVVLQEQERKFALIRHAFFGGAILAVGAYIYHQQDAFVDLYYRIQLLAGIIAAQWGGSDLEDDEDDEDDDDEEEESFGNEDEDRAEGESEDESNF
ncbi:hypothetical protein BC835DRAFT_1408124 [Cytidiella melzeri]|nr:hypothetical protein BC835DRAFT_1408124 [Cytidiella melzeri]